MVIKYMELLTEISSEDISGFRLQLENQSVNPKEIKSTMAKAVVARLYDQEKADRASEEFERIHVQGKVPAEMAETLVAREQINIIDLLIEAKMAVSKSEARRLIEQNAVRLNENTITDPKQIIDLNNKPEGLILNVGPVRHALIKLVK